MTMFPARADMNASALSSVPSASQTQAALVHARNQKAAEKAAKDFESVFLSQMLGHMFEGIKTDPMFGGGAGEDMYKSLMIQQYGKELANHGGIGIAKLLTNQILQLQEAHS